MSIAVAAAGPGSSGAGTGSVVRITGIGPAAIGVGSRVGADPEGYAVSTAPVARGTAPG
jgi:hypothetical protein